MEPDCCAAEVDADGRLTFWASTQMPHGLHGQLAGALGMDKSEIRVVTPQVGGGFGGKAGIHAEYSVVAAACRITGRPVVWVPPRSDDMKALPHSRGQVQYVELGCMDDGTFTGLRVRLVGDSGGYPTIGAYLPGGTRRMSQGTYNVRHDRVRHRRRRHEHDTDGRLPRRRPARGDRPRRARRRPGRVRTRHRPDRDPQEELPRRRRVPVHDDHGQHVRQRSVLVAARSASPKVGYDELRAEQQQTTRRRRSHRCSASASPPTSRSPPAAAPTSSARSRCTPTARRRSSPARCRTARGTRPRTRCWCPTRPASRSTGSRSSTATPTASAPVAEPADHGRSSSADRPCTARPRRWSTRRRSSPLDCSKPTSPTSSSTRRRARSASPVFPRRP